MLKDKKIIGNEMLIKKYLNDSDFIQIVVNSKEREYRYNYKIIEINGQDISDDELYYGYEFVPQKQFVTIRINKNMQQQFKPTNQKAYEHHNYVCVHATYYDEYEDYDLFF